MKRNHYLLLVLIAIFVSCNSHEVRNTLSVDPSEVSFGLNGGTSTFLIETNAGKWSITNPVSDWLTLSSVEGTTTAEKIALTVSSRSLNARTGVLLVSAGNAKPIEVNVSQASSEYLYVLTADANSISFTDPGGSKDVKILTDAVSWAIVPSAAWLHVSKTNGPKGMSVVTITADENIGTNVRTDTVSITAENAATYKIFVTQEKPRYPSYNASPKAPDAVGMTSNAVQIAANIKLGWNLGNTLEAIGSETAWGNPKASKALIDLVKASGFNAVRLPCSWYQYSNLTTAEISSQWLDRVKEVVQYCVDNDMYVLLNIHWDSGWLDNNISVEKQEETKARQKAFWEQIATKMRDFDEHVMFASANEPPVSNETQKNILVSYHQAFIDAVRSTGGKNSYRVLVVQGPSTDIDKTTTYTNILPTDAVPGRMMLEVHYYGPWQFCGLTEDASWGSMFYYWGNGYHSTTDATRNALWGEESYVVDEFQKMKSQFVDKGIPVLLGEYGTIRRTGDLTGDALTLHLAARAYWNKYITQQARAHGMLPFYWDEGSNINHGFGIMNRQNNTVFDQQVLDSVIAGGN